MGDKLRRGLGILLIILGLGLIVYNFIPDFVVNQHAKESQDMVESISKEKISDNQESGGEIDFEAVENLSPDIALNEEDIVSPDLVIGQLVVPSVEMNLPIYKTLDNSTLMSGAAVMRHDMVMGEGNYALAGHYTHTSPNLFGPLRDLKTGEVARITDKDQIYEYEIIDIEVVPPTALEMIEDDQADSYGKPILSLMQCYYENFQNTGNRQFFIGTLRNVYDYDERLLYATEFYDQLPSQ